MTVGTSSLHGTNSRYAYGCRCDPCATAATEYRRDLRRRHLTGEPVRQRSKVAKHGTVGMYNNHRCRCKKCRVSMAEYKRSRRQTQPGVAL